MHLNLSPAAREAAERDLGPDQRLWISFAGGCGALGFRLSATRRAPGADEVQVEFPEVSVVLDRMAAAELDGAVLDYDPDEGFVLDHPEWGVSC